MYHQPIRKKKKKVFPTKKPKTLTQSPISHLMYGRFEGLEVKILILGNSPSLAWDLPQVLPLGDYRLKFLTHEHIVSTLSCVFILCWFLFS